MSASSINDRRGVEAGFRLYKKGRISRRRQKTSHSDLLHHRLQTTMDNKVDRGVTTTPSKPPPGDDPHIVAKTLAHQYGGNSISGWVTLIPSSSVPYIQLARLNPPAGLFLIYFPHLFGILLAGVRQQASLDRVVYASLRMFAGSFFLSNAIHIWNDLIDAPLDALVRRTKNRPIPRGAVSEVNAVIFTLTQAVGASAFLPLLEISLLGAVLWALPSIIAWKYYPWAKRHIDCPQLVLGFCLAWGVVMGSLSMGLRPIASGTSWTIGRPVLCLHLACIVWSILYDSVYAHQDVEDDVKAGIKSLAVLYQNQTKPLLWVLLGTMTILLTACGITAELGAAYYILAVGGSFMALALMISRVQWQESASCWWWFGKGFWWVGFAISGGLLAELARAKQCIL